MKSLSHHDVNKYLANQLLIPAVPSSIPMVLLIQIVYFISVGPAHDSGDADLVSKCDKQQILPSQTLVDSCKHCHCY